MKICMFEVREDEKYTIERLKKELDLDIETFAGPLTLERTNGLVCDGLSILGDTHLDAQLLQALKDRGITKVSTRTIGTNHIDMNAAKTLGIDICNSHYPPYGVAEFTIMLMLMVLRKYKPALYRQNVNDYSLSGLQGKELHSMTVGIIGTGKIGQGVAKILRGFGAKILAYDLYPSKELGTFVQYTDLDTIYAQCDLITLHTPLTEETRHMIDRNSIMKMKKGVILVNAARGELMNIEALIEGIENEQIGGLAMDVFEDEAKIYHYSHVNDIIRNRNMAYLRQFPNVVLTQHIAFYTDVNTASMVECGIRGLIDLIQKG